MEEPPPKRLKVAPFAIHATRGLLRDQKSRRRTMAVSIAIAIILAVTGLTIFRSWLNPHEHPWRFIFFWLACAWETVLAILLAFFDLLLTRSQERAARRALREQLEKKAGSDE
jgi:hypothetical protein